MNKQDDVRRKNLRRLLKDGAEVLNVSSDDLRWLLDEASRLQQSNDRLRRQNRRMRIKVGGDTEQADSDQPNPEEPTTDEVVD